MHANIPLLEKKAIKLALGENWEEAIKVNTEIISEDKSNIKAKIRLGHAYLQTKNFIEATKMFENVLKQDPINKVAKKNYDLAKSKKTNKVINKSKNGKSLVAEPSTTQEVELEITAKGVTANKFSYAEEFKVDVLNGKANIVIGKKIIGTITDPKIVGRLNSAVKINAEVNALFIKGEDKKIKILLECSDPIFKGDKQDVKPYMKKGIIDEPAIEIEIEDFD
jgi:tetratricopeptide (TPR) repeat protein